MLFLGKFIAEHIKVAMDNHMFDLKYGKNIRIF